MGVEHLPGLLEHLLALVDDLVAAQLALADAVHLPLEGGRHLARRDVDRSLLHGRVERGDERHAELGGLDRVVAHVVAVVEVLDDVGARGLGAQAEVLHLLDELALAVAARRLRLLGLRADVEDLERVARLQRRQRPVALGRVLLVHLEVAQRRHPGAVGQERLRAQADVDALPLDDGRRQQRGEEAPRDQVVDLGLVAAQLLLGRAHRIDRRVVGGALLAARRRELVLPGQPGRRGGDRLPAARARAGCRAGRATADRPCCRCAGS